VLYLVEPLDELTFQSISNFKDKVLVDAAKGDLDEIDEIDKNSRDSKSKQHVKAEFEMVSHEIHIYMSAMIFENLSFPMVLICHHPLL
jgi:HSP90 family molecular chaperone